MQCWPTIITRVVLWTRVDCWPEIKKKNLKILQRVIYRYLESSSKIKGCHCYDICLGIKTWNSSQLGPSLETKKQKWTHCWFLKLTSYNPLSNWNSFVNYHRAWIIYFFNFSIFFKNYLFEMLKFKKITREGKTQKNVKTHELLALGQSNIAQQVSNNWQHFFIL